MKQIFRTHSRTLVLVFMSLLLVVFLIDRPAMELFKMATAEKVRIGEAFGKTVTSADYAEAAADATIIREFIGIPEKQLENVEFYLMVTEARKAGIRVGQEQVADLLARIPDAAQRIDRLRSAHNRSVPAIYNALAAFVAVEEYRNLQAGAVLVSAGRVKQSFADMQQDASVELSVLDANSFLRHVSEPTEEELQKAFDEGKSRTTAHEDEKLVFGYLEPDRVKIEYLTVDPEAIKAQITISLKDAKLYYEQNKTKYVKDVPVPGPTQGPTPETTKAQQTFDEVESQVRNDARAEKAIREALKLVETIQREAAKPWEAMPVDKDGFREAPPAEKQLSFEALKAKFGTEYPVKVETAGWLDKLNFSSQAGLVGMSTVSGSRGDTGQELAFRVKGIYKATEGEKRPAMLNVGEPSPLLLRISPMPGRQSAPTAAYFLRVTEVKPSGPPESLAAVRDKVVADVKYAKAFEMARQWADKIETRAKEVGLKAAVDEMTELKTLLEPAPTTQPDGPPPSREAVEALGPFTPPGDFRSRPSGQIPHVGYVTKLHTSVFDALRARTATSPAHTIVRTPDVQYNAYQASTTGKIILAEATELKPVYQGDYDKLRDRLLANSVRQLRESFGDFWDATEKRHLRTKYKPAER